MNSRRRPFPFLGSSLTIERPLHQHSARYRFLLDSPLRPSSFARIRNVAIPDSRRRPFLFKAIPIRFAYTNFLDTIIDELLDVFEIKRSLSAKGCPYDNSVDESTNKILKAEFVHGERFSTLRELQAKLSDYVNWYNNFRLHSTLGYMSPVEFRLAGLTL